MILNRNGAIVGLAISLLLTVTSQSQAVVPVFDPANYAQNVLTQANTLKTTINQANQIANQIREIQMQVQSLRNIPRGLWGQIQSDLAQLQAIVQRSQGISYANVNLAADFAKSYPGFRASTDYTAAYRQWTQKALGGIKTSLEDAGLQSRQLQSEDAVMQALQAMSDGASGHMQALQVGNMIAIQQVQQLQKLRQLQMAQIQAEAGFLAMQQQSQSGQYAALKLWIESAGDPAFKF